MALRPFFVTYASVPTHASNKNQREEVLRDVQLKLLHEASHLMGLDETQAREWSQKMMTVLMNDFLLCETTVPERMRVREARVIQLLTGRGISCEVYHPDYDLNDCELRSLAMGKKPEGAKQIAEGGVEKFREYWEELQNDSKDSLFRSSYDPGQLLYTFVNERHPDQVSRMRMRNPAGPIPVKASFDTPWEKDQAWICTEIFFSGR